jgi:hypothetical protein
MSMTKPTAEQVTYKGKGIGAVTRTVESKLADVVSVKDFGAVGDGVADDTAAIQAAIDYVIYNTGSTVPVNHPGAVFMPGGRYRITDTIHLGYGEIFHSVRLYGDGRKYRANNLFRGTAIVADFNDRPAIAVQGGRNTTIEKMSIVGKNVNWVTTNFLGNPFLTPLVDDLIASNWIDPSFPASASSQFAPYCAIAVDPYSGPRPAVSYPNVNYPNWLNITTQYGKQFSDHTTISQVEIDGFVVGVAVQPCDADGNGDYTRMMDCRVERSAYGISVGNTQARDFTVSDVQFLYLHSAINTGLYGRRNGRPNFDVRNCSFNFSTMAAQIPNMPFGGSLAFQTCYAEGLYMIGIINATSGTFEIQHPLSFYDCEFRFDGWVARGKPVSIYSSNGAPTTFIGCSFYPGGTKPAFFYMSCSPVTPMINCTFQAGADCTKRYEKVAANAACGVVFVNGSASQAPYSGRMTQIWDVNTGSKVAGIAGFTFSDHGTIPQVGVCRYVGIPMHVKTIDTLNNEVPIAFPRAFGSFMNKNQCTSISQSGRTVTVDVTGAYTAQSIFQIGGDVGDIIVDSTTGTAFIVAARTGLTLTLVAENNYDALGNLRSTISLASGFFYTTNCRLYTLRFPHWGDTSSSSANITNVKRGDGATINLNDASFGTQVGDALCAGGVGRPLVTAANAPITNIVSDTITLTGNCRLTQTHTRMDLFVRAPTPNNT